MVVQVEAQEVRQVGQVGAAGSRIEVFLYGSACSLGSCTRRTSACVKNTAATCTWPVFVCISECSHSMRYIYGIFPTGESLKVTTETDANETPSISPACVNTACPYMKCTWEKSLKGRICPVFMYRTRMDVGWHSTRLHLNVSFADKISHLLPPRLVKFHFSNFKSHRLAPHIALALQLRLWFSARRGYWSGSNEQRASRPDSEWRSHISKHVELNRDIGLGISQDGALVI